MPGKKKKAPSPPGSVRSTGSFVLRATGPKQALSRSAQGLASLPQDSKNPYDQFGRESANYDLPDYDDVLVGNGFGKSSYR